ERVLRQEYIEGNLNQFNQLDYPDKNAITNSMIKAYILHVLKVGTSEERQGILGVIKTKFILHNRELRIK
ncbi:MAG: hypothetical protein U1E54_02620, partial [Candidatus Levybacteria bacterium]|nr:hypothetical protein [Candidatus Levybacteria bacterium]